VFTVEALADGSALKLQPTGRYAHSRSHLLECLRAAGFDEPHVEAAVSRSEGGRDVAGWLVSARRAVAS